ncbi:MAG: serine/threonine-protein kinase, partial [Halothece sp. Uz-M2-17]|nr:serine/threonine-protein kinase [Halothece sp. Uz-M2-17]
MNRDFAYCLNPYCSQPKNSPHHRQCNNCGFRLLIAEQYHAQKLIASGRFGRTFLGEDIKHDRPCIIKQFFPKTEQGITLNSRKAIQLFHSEAQRLEELGDHPQIPQLYAHLEQETYQYLIQEWIAGDNLDTELSEQGRFDERAVRRLLTSLLPVLNYLRDRAVIHRDLKPENIIHRYETEPEYVLVDFGAAKLASLRSLAKTGTIIGSPGYAAPEQVYGKPTFASDIYSLGVTCIHLLTGVSPFDLYHPTENKLLWRDYCQDNPISDSLSAILDGMTRFDLKERYSSAEEVLSALGVLSPLTPSPDVSQPNPSETASIIKLYSGKGAIYSLAFSHDGRFLASGGGSEWGKLVGKDNSIRLWEVGKWNNHRKLTQHSAPITTVKFSSDGQFLISASLDKTIKVWNLETHQLQQTLKGHRFGIKTLQVSPYDDTILSGSFGGEVILWNLHTGRVLDRFSWE